MQSTTDHTIFAWESDTSNGNTLAPDVSYFSGGADYQPSTFETILSRNFYDPGSFQPIMRAQEMMPAYEMTNARLRIQLPVRSIIGHKTMYFAFLACKNQRKPEIMVAMCIRWYEGFQQAHTAQLGAKYPQSCNYN